MKHMKYLAGALLMVGVVGLMNAAPAPAQSITIENYSATGGFKDLTKLKFNNADEQDINIAQSKKQTFEVPAGATTFTVKGTNYDDKLVVAQIAEEGGSWKTSSQNIPVFLGAKYQVWAGGMSLLGVWCKKADGTTCWKK